MRLEIIELESMVRLLCARCGSLVQGSDEAPAKRMRKFVGALRIGE